MCKMNPAGLARSLMVFERGRWELEGELCLLSASSPLAQLARFEIFGVSYRAIRESQHRWMPDSHRG
jgi:hypothetical protein